MNVVIPPMISCFMDEAEDFTEKSFSIISCTNFIIIFLFSLATIFDKIRR